MSTTLAVTPPAARRSSRGPFVLLCLFLALLPVDGTDYLSFLVREMHVSVLDLIVIGLLFLSAMEAAVWGAGLTGFTRRVLALLVLAILLSSVSLLYLPGDFLRFDVKITLNLIEFGAVLYAATATLRDFPATRRAFHAIAFGAAVIALLTLLKSLGMDLPGHVRATARPVGPFRFGVTGFTQFGPAFSTPILAGLAVPLAPRVIARRWLAAALAALIVLAAAIAFARSLWIATCVQLLTALFLSLRRARVRAWRAVGGAGFVALVVLAMVNGRDLYDALVELRPATVAERMSGYGEAIEAATRSPLGFLFGAGKGAFVATFEGLVPHNLILDLLVSKGILTLLAVLALLGMVVVRLARLTRPGASSVPDGASGLAEMGLIALAGLGTEALFTPLTTSLVFWVEVAMLCSFLALIERSEEEDPWPAVVARATVGATRVRSASST